MYTNWVEIKTSSKVYVCPNIHTYIHTYTHIHTHKQTYIHRHKLIRASRSVDIIYFSSTSYSERKVQIKI